MFPPTVSSQGLPDDKREIICYPNEGEIQVYILLSDILMKQRDFVALKIIHTYIYDWCITHLLVQTFVSSIDMQLQGSSDLVAFPSPLGKCNLCTPQTYKYQTKQSKSVTIKQSINVFSKRKMNIEVCK